MKLFEVHRKSVTYVILHLCEGQLLQKKKKKKKVNEITHCMYINKFEGKISIDYVMHTINIIFFIVNLN